MSDSSSQGPDERPPVILALPPRQETSPGRFGVWRADQAADRRDWIAHWQRWPAREVFAHPDYVRLFAADGDQACCAFWTSEGENVLYPFVLRDVTPLRVWSEGVGPATDIVSPYGYGGPFAWNAEDESGSASTWSGDPFWSRFESWAHRENVVSEFVRFSLCERHQLPYPGTTIENQPNVIRGLDLDEDGLWADVMPKVRRNIRRARSEGVEVELDVAGARLDDFHRIYLATMDRRRAERRYYFPREFFEQIRATLGGQFVLFHGLHGGEVITSELVLVSAENVYFYLGGSDYRFARLRPNDLLKFEIARWARETGKRRYVLGGGHSPGDGIFRFKQSFAPRGVVPFYVGQRIFDQQVYARLLRQHADLQGGHAAEGGFFPAYRAGRPSEQRAA